MTTNSGTIDYAPTGKVKVVGYYAYSSGSPTSNKIEKTIGSSAKLDKVNYSITSGGSSVNGSTTATSSVAIKVNAQSSSNTITIQFMNSFRRNNCSPSTFTGSATKESSALTPGAQYTLKSLKVMVLIQLVLQSVLLLVVIQTLENNNKNISF